MLGEMQVALNYERLSRRPHNFLRLSGVSVDKFNQIIKDIAIE